MQLHQRKMPHSGSRCAAAYSHRISHRAQKNVLMRKNCCVPNLELGPARTLRSFLRAQRDMPSCDSTGWFPPVAKITSVPLSGSLLFRKYPSPFRVVCCCFSHSDVPFEQFAAVQNILVSLEQNAPSCFSITPVPFKRFAFVCSKTSRFCFSSTRALRVVCSLVKNYFSPF